MAEAQKSFFPKLTGSYLGQKLPGTTPEMFAKNLNLNNNGHGGFVFSKKGNEVFFFSIKHNGKYVVMYSETKDGYWQPPLRISQSTSGHELHPFYSADGNKLFFGCNRRIQPNQRVHYSNLWFIERNDTGWSELQPLPPIINTGYESCGSFANDNTLYFRRISKATRGDIFQSDYVNGEFQKPIKLPKGINTGYDESHPAISLDGSYLIFSSKRPGGFNNGRDALWIAFKSAEGKWGKALNLGRKINNGNNTSCATISPNGKYVFFMRIEKGKGVPYWVSSKIIEELRPKE
jgi:Tol biopolymer transport system component